MVGPPRPPKRQPGPDGTNADEGQTHEEVTMFEEIRIRKINLGTNWVKSETGNTYLCPIGADVSGLSDDELRKLCIEESYNPQND